MAERYIRACQFPFPLPLWPYFLGLHYLLLRCLTLLNFSLSLWCFLSLVHCSSDLVSSWSKAFGISVFAKTDLSLLSVPTTICFSPQTFPVPLVFYTDWTVIECLGDLIFAFLVLSSCSLTVFGNQNKFTCLLISVFLSGFSSEILPFTLDFLDFLLTLHKQDVIVVFSVNCHRTTSFLLLHINS